MGELNDNEGISHPAIACARGSAAVFIAGGDARGLGANH
jgi:hypothetical protein